MAADEEEFRRVPEGRGRNLSVESGEIFDGIAEFLKIPCSKNAEYSAHCRRFLTQFPLQNLFPLLLMEYSSKRTAQAIEQIFFSPLGPHLMRSEKVVEFVLQGLNSSDEEILPIVSLNTFVAFTTEADFVYLATSPLLTALIGLVQNEEQAEISTKAISIIKSGCQKYSTFCEKFLSQTDLLLDACGPFPLAALVAEVAIMHPKGLKKYRRRGHFADLLTRLKGEDVLVKLSVLKLLEELCESELGYTLVTSSKIMESLVQSLREFSYESSGCLELIDKMAEKSHVYTRSGNWNQIESIPQALYDCLEQEQNDIIRQNTCVTIGWLCTLSSELGKYKEHACKVIQFIFSSNQELKVAALHGISQLLTSKTELSSPESVIQQNILHHLDDHNSTTVAKITKLCENPIDDIRFAAFRLVVELAQQKWGLEFIVQAPGFLEFLTKRNFDSKVALEWRYSALQHMFKNPSKDQYFSETSLQKIDLYLRQGIFYQEPTPVLATKEQGI